MFFELRNSSCQASTWFLWEGLFICELVHYLFLKHLLSTHVPAGWGIYILYMEVPRRTEHRCFKNKVDCAHYHRRGEMDEVRWSSELGEISASFWGR